ncbi:GGDEF domain-containing protein [Pseudoalteromonas fuliginea]|uniref:Diguanylate phosphodiesterase n=1 Tax=Pseudoalteromonas fuliginea TaxID=1872678 RepID=A0ABD3Y5D1_9GAMM|nr:MULTISPECIES: GGDEF domain-containing protein [Pseudoalteromonas]KDC49381.1 diguanylate phosphodiesterase [Pseudoalteromonas fuliginea]KJZ26685.1 diguanylate phosphodiesterase [Pseudoalteromonas fuliginea]GAA78175.1 diguanylate cyclase/phosphodiesterase [Pseudoalteromonas sp. BSi20495]
MAGFKKLIFIQIISWLLCVAAGSYFISVSFDNAVSEAQKNAQASVTNYINDLSFDDNLVQNLKKSLADGKTFSSFTLRDYQGAEVFKVNSPIDLPLFADFIQSIFNSARPQFAVNKAADIKVEFTVNIQHLAEQLQISLFIIIFISAVLVIIPIILMQSIFYQLNKSISMTVSDVIDVYINQNQAGELETVLDSSKLKSLGKDLVPSFNRLSHFLKTKNEYIQSEALSIKHEAYKDVITALGNRNMFVEYYEKNIENSEQSTFGSLAMIRCSELQAINQSRGYQKGDEYVKGVADIIKHISGTYAGSQLFRLNSSDFAVVLPHIPLKEAERFGENLQSRFTQYQQNQELSSVANTGIVGYEKGKPLGELLSVVDNAMSMAQSKQINAWHVQRESDLVNNVSAGFGNQNWRKVINEVIESKRVHLVMQNIMPLGKSIKAYAEIQVRFKTEDNQVLPTASFLAMAEKLGMAVDIDKLIIDSSLEKVKSRNLSEKYFGLNVTASSAHNDQFVIWLERRLLKDTHIASKLIFEVSEFGLQQNIKASKRFIDMVHRVGARVTVERFGVGLTSFKFFRDLKPDFIKMDASYTRGLEDDKNNQYFMRLMVDLAHRIGVNVFAEGVESQEEKHIIETLCLDGVQGYYIEKPKDI